MLTLHTPAPEELWFREEMLADPVTMAYNRAWGGTIPFPREAWPNWYRKWITDAGEVRFYRYLKDSDTDAFVGEIAYHWDAACQAARENGVDVLYDDIAADNPAVGLFLREGFEKEADLGTTILLKKTLT